MLRNLAEKSTLMLLKSGVIQTNKQKIYIYGFELFLSTLFCILSILTFGLVFRVFQLTVIFLLFFIPIRIVAGGYHAKSYESCFILTNLIAMFAVILSELLSQIPLEWIKYILYALVFISFAYIWKQAPVISEIYPQKASRISKNKKYAHIIIIIECVSIFGAERFFNSCWGYTAIVTTYIVATMIAITVKGGEKPCK